MNKDKKIEIKKIKKLIIMFLIFFASFILSKMDILNFKIGVSIIFLFYIMINIIIISLYFKSKRTKILLYIFLTGNIFYFMFAAFSLKSILYYFLWIWLFTFLVRQNEGKSEIKYILEYDMIYTIFALLHLLLLSFV